MATRSFKKCRILTLQAELLRNKQTLPRTIYILPFVEGNSGLDNGMGCLTRSECEKFHERIFEICKAFWPMHGKRRSAIGLISTGDYACLRHKWEDALSRLCD
ncbi:hypothetical protein ARMGADRAFT_1026418 [Armillaria gallica]|uniref:Uncharacterized protein n=1 Tax=Armillaria gallica TaxID=47427 RepID=A0A2H3EAL2_ARMGA|nr:hypothetical protein ARMGADRAFT_1026418 [Armillaria gallica]